MPYEVVKDGDEFVCRKKGGKMLGRHKTKAQAEAQMRALYASERRHAAGKSLDADDAGELLVFQGDSVKAQGDEGRFGGYLIRFGSPDLPDRTATKDYFTPETELGRFVVGKIDVLHHHSLPMVKGQPNTLADTIIGEAEVTRHDEGWWLEGRLDLSIPGVAETIWSPMKADDDLFGLSSGAVSHLVRRVRQANDTHWIKRWPVVEASLTPEPGELRATAVALKSLIEPEDDDSDPELVVESFLKAASDLRDVVARFAKIGPSKRSAIRELRDSLGELYRASAPVDPAEIERMKAEVDGLMSRL